MDADRCRHNGTEGGRKKGVDKSLISLISDFQCKSCFGRPVVFRDWIIDEGIELTRPVHLSLSYINPSEMSSYDIE